MEQLAAAATNLWTTFVFEDNNFMLKIGDSGKVCLTDLKSIWVQNTNREELIQAFRRLNPLYCGESDEIFAVILKTLQELKQVESLMQIEDGYRLEIKWMCNSLPVSINFILKKGDSDLYFKEMTIPFIKTIQFLEFSNRKMVEELQRKDREIQEYKIEFNSEIERKTLITSEYMEKDKLNTNGLILNVFTKSDLFQERLNEKYGDVKEIYPELTTQITERKVLKLPKKKKRMS